MGTRTGISTAQIATAVAVASIAVAAQCVAHELIGHGSGCLLSGGRPLFVDFIVFDCSKSTWLADAGGPAGNILFGVPALLAFRKSKAFTPGSYFLWLFAALNLLVVTGYLIQSCLINHSDWSALTAALRPVWLWRILLVFSGIALYYAALRSLGRSIIAAVNRGALHPIDIKPLMLSAYLTCAVLSVASGALNPDGTVLLLRNALPQGFLALLGLLFLTRYVPARAVAPAHVPSLPASRIWTVFGGVTACLFVFVFGPGVRF